MSSVWKSQWAECILSSHSQQVYTSLPAVSNIQCSKSSVWKSHHSQCSHYLMFSVPCLMFSIYSNVLCSMSSVRKSQQVECTGCILSSGCIRTHYTSLYTSMCTSLYTSLPTVGAPFAGGPSLYILLHFYYGTGIPLFVHKFLFMQGATRLLLVLASPL